MQVAEAMYVEPSTGRCYPLAKAPYLGVESLWNHANYWVCMQMPEPHSDSRAVPHQLSLDLTDSSKWEYLLPNAPTQVCMKDRHDHLTCALARLHEERVCIDAVPCFQLAAPSGMHCCMLCYDDIPVPTNPCGMLVSRACILQTVRM